MRPRSPERETWGKRSPGCTRPGGSVADGADFAGRYAQVFSTSAQVVPIESDVTFDTNGILNGSTHAPGTSSLQVTETGVYAVRFSVSSVEPNQIALFVNGALAAAFTLPTLTGVTQPNVNAWMLVEKVA